jgi:hypothetical protein
MRKLPALALIPLLLLSGCAGSSKDLGANHSVSASPSIDPATLTPTEPNNTFVPKFHTHDYWAGRPSVQLFGNPFYTLQIGQNVVQEATYEGDSLILGRVEFDTKTDGEDVNAADKTDVVFQGTSRITAMFKWTDSQNVPGLKFYYKPANTPTYTLLGPITSGETYTIDMRPHWADMPHQLSLSRWKFRLDAFDPTTNAGPVKPNRGQGKIDASMTIFNGGERFIDPPHPYFFAAGPVRPAGEVTVSLENCAVVNNTRPGGEDLPVSSFSTGCGANPKGPMDYKPPAPAIVPWETTKMELHLYWNYTGPAPTPPVLGLKFHGGDTDVYRYPAAKAKTANSATYEIGVSEVMTDSPYASETDWRYGVYPIIQDQKDYGGAFTGKIHIVTFAIKEGDAVRGMGN